MEDIFNIPTKLEIHSAVKKPEDALLIKIETGDSKDSFKKPDSIAINSDHGKEIVIFYTPETVKGDTWRSLGGTMIKWIQEKGLQKVYIDYGSADPIRLLVGFMLGAYRFDKYKKEAQIPEMCDLYINVDKAEIEKRQIICNAVNMAREWGHEPGSVINPWTLSDRAESLAKKYNLKCTVLDDKQLLQMGAGGIVAVGQGSKTPSRMIILEYPGTKKEKPVVLVGKAITFDAGGYSIKSSENIQTMKYDKCGALDVMAVLRAASELKLETPVIGIICAAENMLSDKSYRPDDILTMLSGLSVQVISTDAEGRLVLADGLTYAQKNYKPAAIVDYATLTGGIVVALADVRAGSFCNNDALFNELDQSGNEVWERIWRMPLDEEYSQMLKAPDADIKNSAGRYGSSATAAAFLHRFVDDKIPWMHLDIAGVADTTKPNTYNVEGATGFGIRLTLNWLMNHFENN